MSHADELLHEAVPLLLSRVQRARAAAYRAYIESVCQELTLIEMLDELIRAFVRTDEGKEPPPKLDLGPVRRAVEGLKGRTE